jgi:hypothetical protein
MYIKNLSFQVEFSSYAESHFCRDFYKKYRGRMWIETKKTITDTLQRAFLVQQTSLIDVLKYSQEDNIGIFKFDFKVAGTPVSPKTSGNRAVFYLCNNTGKINILLVYGKDHCDKRHSETQWVLEQIKANFPEYRKLC